MFAFVSYSTPQRLRWKDLDAMKTADEIAQFLLAYGIKGAPNSMNHCPLAVATDSRVSYSWRQRYIWFRKLTMAQKKFVHNFDDGYYPYLVK